jgi:hypothetical protein
MLIVTGISGHNESRITMAVTSFTVDAGASRALACLESMIVPLSSMTTHAFAGIDGPADAEYGIIASRHRVRPAIYKAVFDILCLPKGKLNEFPRYLQKY